MNDYNDVRVSDEAIERLKRKIIIQENRNLKTREKNDREMINCIKKMIEEEVQCCLNQ
jgi:hypothetical protein